MSLKVYNSLSRNSLQVYLNKIQQIYEFWNSDPLVKCRFPPLCSGTRTLAWKVKMTKGKIPVPWIQTHQNERNANNIDMCTWRAWFCLDRWARACNHHPSCRCWEAPSLQVTAAQSALRPTTPAQQILYKWLSIDYWHMFSNTRTSSDGS